jgi:hypothetical protein
MCRESFLETGLLDFPNLFQWFFHTSSDGPSVAEMGIVEALMIFHHTKYAVREQHLEITEQDYYIESFRTFH